MATAACETKVTQVDSPDFVRCQNASPFSGGLNPSVLEVVRRAGFDERLDRKRLLFNVHAASERYQALAADLGGNVQRVVL